MQHVRGQRARPPRPAQVLLPEVHAVAHEARAGGLAGVALLRRLGERAACGAPDLQACFGRLLWHCHRAMLHALSAWCAARALAPTPRPGAMRTVAQPLLPHMQSCENCAGMQFVAHSPGTCQRCQCPYGPGPGRGRTFTCNRLLRYLQCGGRRRMVHGLLEGAAGELFVRRAEPAAAAAASGPPSAEDVAAAEWHSGFYVRARAPAPPAGPPPRTLGRALRAVPGSSCACQGLQCACGCR
jgi:hypothetical protein